MAAKNDKIYCEQFVLKQGKCKCPGYVENKSKWSKGKCNRCLHDKSFHNYIENEDQINDVQKEEVNEQKEPAQNEPQEPESEQKEAEPEPEPEQQEEPPADEVEEVAE